MPSASRPGDVRAAGAVVLRKGRVLLVHRPAYDDWSFPKGKLDRGETASPPRSARSRRRPGCGCGSASRSRGSPTRRRPGPRSSTTGSGGWWATTTCRGYLVNHEIDEVAWVKVEKAADLLTYKRDRRTLAEALHTGKATRALVVLRHGQARARKSGGATTGSAP